MPLYDRKAAPYPAVMVPFEAPEVPLVRLSTDVLRAKEYLEAIVASSSDAICTTDVRGRIIYFSPGAEAMFGTTSREMVGRPAHELYDDGPDEARRIMRVLRRDGCLQDHELIMRGADGKRLHVSMSASLLRDRGGRVIGTLGISKDITRRVELERRLRALSLTDPLTGLFNPRHLKERIAQEAQRARRQRLPLSLIAIDLDRFKQVNDTRGHLAGDRVLRGFAATIQHNIRKGVDAAFRTGGDEFVVLLPGLSLARAERVAERLSAGARTRAISFSYGISSLRRGRTTSDLAREADERMFRMKRTRSATR